jgi:hypothetical protein
LTKSELKTALIALRFINPDIAEVEMNEIDEDLDVRKTHTLLIGSDHFISKWSVDDYEFGRL